LTRKDGLVMGFTDHDRDLRFEGVDFQARSGLDAAAVQSSTGLSVDNSNAVGALSADGLTEDDIRAGRYDGAVIKAWLVNWANPAERVLQFQGSVGEIQRSGGMFEAELRGLAEAMNQVQGRAYHRKCAAVLGDATCGFDLGEVGYFADVPIEGASGVNRFRFEGLSGFDLRWFEGGVLRVLTGSAEGLVAMIRADRFRDGAREMRLWQDLALPVAPGDLVRLQAGCDKRVETCRLKFHNLLNYRGFPNIPGEDWAMSYPVRAGVNDGGSLS
jgi:uncharacterized phage protein (TIGR02218 family)